MNSEPAQVSSEFFSVLVGNVFATPAGLYSQEPAAKSSILLVEGAAAAGLDFVVRNGSRLDTNTRWRPFPVAWQSSILTATAGLISFAPMALPCPRW